MYQPSTTKTTISEINAELIWDHNGRPRAERLMWKYEPNSPHRSEATKAGRQNRNHGSDDHGQATPTRDEGLRG